MFTIISGAQLGADYGALLAAKQLGLKTQGFLPKGFIRDDGEGKRIAEEFGLLESDGGYSKKDRQNVDLCDCVIGFLVSKPMTGRGTTQTLRYALYKTYDDKEYFTKKGDYEFILGEKPVFIVWDLNETNLNQVSLALKEFIENYKPKKIMISGITAKTEPTLQFNVEQLLIKTLQ